jgi:hypothetical protein
MIYWNDILDKNLFYNSISAHKGASFVKRKYSPQEGYHSFHIRTTSHKFLFLFWTNRKKSQRKRQQIRPLYSYIHRWKHPGKVYLSIGNFDWCKVISLEWFFLSWRNPRMFNHNRRGEVAVRPDWICKRVVPLDRSRKGYQSLLVFLFFFVLIFWKNFKVLNSFIQKLIQPADQ